MTKDVKLDIIKLVAQPYNIELLRELKVPQRFNELKKICRNDRTLAKRIKALQDNGLIGPVAVKKGGKYINFYKTTDRGKNLLKKVESLKL
jgi:DNA-binding HxlR family transcriptional regulator